MDSTNQVGKLGNINTGKGGGGGGVAGGWVDDGIVVRLETASDNVGIGTPAPGAFKLRVLGTVQEDLGVANEFIRRLTVDAYARPQIWMTAPNSVLRLGADSADGDAFDADSEGIVVYQTSANRLARIKPNRFGLTRATDSSLYYFRADESSMYYRADPPGGAVHFSVDRTSGFVGIGTTTQSGTELLRVNGAARVDGKLTVTGLIDPIGLVVDEQASVPGGAPGAAKGTFWIKDDAPNKPYFTDDAGTDHDLLGGAVSPWAQAAGVVNPTNIAWNVVVGAASMSGGGEKLRVIGHTSLAGSILFEYGTGGLIQPNKPAGTTYQPGNGLYLYGGEGGDANGMTGEGGISRFFGGRGGDCLDATADGGYGAICQVAGGAGGSTAGAGNKGGSGARLELSGGRGGTGTGGANAGPGGAIQITGGQGGSVSGGGTFANGGYISIAAGSSGGLNAFGNYTQIGGGVAGGSGLAGYLDLRGGRHTGAGPHGRIDIGAQWTGAINIGNAADLPPINLLGGDVTLTGVWKTFAADGDTCLGGVAMAGTERLRVVGDARVEGKLTVTGLIDPTGLVVDEQASVPGGAPGAAKGTFWIKDDAPNKPYFTDDAGTDHDLLGGAVSPWAQAAGVVNPTNIAWNVVVGAAAMAGAEKFRVVGDVSLSEDINLEHGAGGGRHYFSGADAPAGIAADSIYIQGGDGGAHVSTPGTGSHIREYAGDGGPATASGTGGPPGHIELIAGEGGQGSGTAAGNFGGHAELRGGLGGATFGSGNAGLGGEARLIGGVAGQAVGAGASGIGGAAIVTGGSGDPSTNSEGGPVRIDGGEGYNNEDGGDVWINGGQGGAGGGADGKVKIGQQFTSVVELGNVATDPDVRFLGTGLISLEATGNRTIKVEDAAPGAAGKQLYIETGRGGDNASGNAFNGGRLWARAAEGGSTTNVGSTGGRGGQTWFQGGYGGYADGATSTAGIGGGITLQGGEGGYGQTGADGGPGGVAVLQGGGGGGTDGGGGAGGAAGGALVHGGGSTTVGGDVDIEGGDGGIQNGTINIGVATSTLAINIGNAVDNPPINFLSDVIFAQPSVAKADQTVWETAPAPGSPSYEQRFTGRTSAASRNMSIWNDADAASDTKRLAISDDVHGLAFAFEATVTSESVMWFPLANEVQFRDAGGSSIMRMATNAWAIHGSAPVAKPTIVGSRAANVALANLLTALASQGILTDSTAA